jgi:hypothetical protein
MARSTPSPFDIGAGGAPLGALKARGGNFAAISALIVRLPLRDKPGFRLLSWSNIAVVFLAMQGLQVWDNIHFSLFTLFGGGVVYGDHTSLFYFAFLWLALAVFENFKRLDEEKRGVQPHNFSPEESRFDLAGFLPLSPKVIAIAVEPGLAFLAGAILRRLGFSMLGWVIIGSAFCFAFSEWQFFEQVREHRRDLHDIGLEAQWEAGLANTSAARQDGIENSEPIHTGIDGLEREIENRRQGRAGEPAEGGAL